MHLNLSVDGLLLAAVPVDPKKSKDKEYLNVLTNLLAVKNQSAINASRKQPLYYLEVGSKINRTRNKRRA